MQRVWGVFLMPEKKIIKGEVTRYTEQEWNSLSKLEKKKIIREIKLERLSKYG